MPDHGARHPAPVRIPDGRLDEVGGSVTPHPFRQRMKALEVACDQREFLMSAPAFELALTRTGREGHLVRG